MSDSFEYRTLLDLKCTEQLDIILKRPDKKVVHSLLYEDFISEDIHDDILHARSMMRPDQKADELVKGIKSAVQIKPGKFFTLLEIFTKAGGMYQTVADTLEKKYRELQQQTNIAQPPLQPVQSSAYDSYAQPYQSVSGSHGNASPHVYGYSNGATVPPQQQSPQQWEQSGNASAGIPPQQLPPQQLPSAVQSPTVSAIGGPGGKTLPPGGSALPPGGNSLPPGSGNLPSYASSPGYQSLASDVMQPHASPPPPYSTLPPSTPPSGQTMADGQDCEVVSDSESLGIR